MIYWFFSQQHVGSFRMMSFNSCQIEGSWGTPEQEESFLTWGHCKQETPFITLWPDNTSPNWHLSNPWLQTSRCLACVGWARFGIREVWVSMWCRKMAVCQLGRGGMTHNNNSNNSTYQDPQLQVITVPLPSLTEKNLFNDIKMFWHF